MSEGKIFYTKPSITELEIEYVTDAIENGWGDQCYDYIKKFESTFSNFFEGSEVLATSSCTGALHLGVKALGLGNKDEVIVPESTWIASVTPFIYEGLKPVFVDIERSNWCLDPSKIEEKITENTKAILVTHLYGNAAHIEEISKIAKKNNLYLIEDVAQSLGTLVNGKKLGTYGDIAVFSFHGTKMMTTGEGGAIISNHPTLMDKIRILNDHGRIPEEKRPFYSHEIGLKYKISNLQAALGLAQIKRVNSLIDRKRDIFFSYYQLLENFPELILNEVNDSIRSAYWLPTAIISGISEKVRDELMEELKQKNIFVRPFFYPLSMLPMFESVPDNNVAYDLYSRGINLPSFHDMTLDQIQRVVNEVVGFLRVKKVINA